MLPAQFWKNLLSQEKFLKTAKLSKVIGSMQEHFVNIKQNIAKLC